MSFFISPVIALIVLVPLVACAIVLLDALSERADAAAGKAKKRQDEVRWSERALVFGTGGSLVCTLYALLRLVTSGQRYGFFQLLRCIRIGMTDMPLTMSLDLMRAILAVAVAAAATWAGVLLAKRAPTRVHAAILVLLTGAEIALTADGALGVVAGISILGLGALATPSMNGEALVRTYGAAAIFALLGSAFLCWGIAGSWSDGDYTPEMYPRFIPSTSSRGVSEEGRASRTKAESGKFGAVSVLAMGGAFVYLDEARVPWELEKKPVRTPVNEAPLAAGLHSFRIHPGFGLDDSTMTHLMIEDGKTLAFVPVGATLSPREVQDQLDVLPAPTEDMPVPTRDGFGTVRVLGLSVATLAQWLFVIAGAFLAFASLAWKGERPSPDGRALSTALLSVACATVYRVNFLGRVPAALWLLILGAAAALGFFASRAQAARARGQVAGAGVQAAHERNPVPITVRIANAFLAFDHRVVDAPFRALSLSKIASKPVILGLFLALFIVAAPAQARAAADDRPSVALTVNGGRGPLVLTPKGNDLTGQFEIVNNGKAALSVLRVSIRTDVHDVRAPVTLSAKADSPLPATLVPGGHLRTTVTLGRNAKVEELYAHVIVTTTDEAAGEVAMGVIGHTTFRAAAPLGRNTLSVLVAVLAGAALLVLVLQAMRIGWAGRAAAAGAVAALAVLGLLVYRFDPALTRGDGNDGLSFIEKTSLFPALGSEWFLAVDGLALVVALAVVLCLGITLLFVEGLELPSFERPFLLLAGAAGTGAIFARDLLVFLVFFGAACALLVLVVRAASRRGSHAFGKARAIVFLALVGIALTIFAIQGASDRSFLVDGTIVPHTFSVSDLSRVVLAQKHVTFAGFALVKSGFVVLFVAFAALAGAPPFHTFTLDTMRDSRPTGIFAVALLRGLGLYGLVHVVMPVLPESSRWGAGGVSLLAVFGAVYAAICAFGAKTIGQKLGYLIAAQASFSLLGFSAVAPQGVTAVFFGILSILIASTAAGALVASGVDLTGDARQLKSLDVKRRGALAFALFAAAGMPGFPGFYVLFSGTLGATARHPAAVLVVVIAFAFVAMTVAALVPALIAERGPAQTALTQAQGWAFFILFFAVLTTGVFPATCLDLAANAIRDRAATADPPGATEVAARDPAQGTSRVAVLTP